jgi:hypothetical protein
MNSERFEMTTEDLNRIDLALSALVIHDGYSAGARSAALRFNSQVQHERCRFEHVRAAHGQVSTVSPDVEIELRAAAAMYVVERERIIRVWSIPLRARLARRDA